MNATTPPYAGLHANGTGPFILVSHEPGVKTVWKRNPNWWDKPRSNIDEVVFTPIPNAVPPKMKPATATPATITAIIIKIPRLDITDEPPV